MVIASFSTLVFNANPLMRFDGYYILTDLIEIPNFRANRARCGAPVQDASLRPDSEDPVLARMPLPKKRFALFTSMPSFVALRLLRNL